MAAYLIFYDICAIFNDAVVFFLLIMVIRYECACDVCVIGGGLGVCSSASYLALKKTYHIVAFAILQGKDLSFGRFDKERIYVRNVCES